MESLGVSDTGLCFQETRLPIRRDHEHEWFFSRKTPYCPRYLGPTVFLSLRQCLRNLPPAEEPTHRHEKSAHWSPHRAAQHSRPPCPKPAECQSASWR